VGYVQREKDGGRKLDRCKTRGKKPTNKI